MVWAQRAKPQKNTAQRWREQRWQRERNIAKRMHGREINPKVAGEMERERKRQLTMTDSERAERIRKRDEQLADSKPMTPSEKREQRKKQREHVRYALREQKRQAEQRGSYLADFAPAGQRVRCSTEQILNELHNVDHLVEFSRDGRLMKVAGRIFESDGRHSAQTHAHDAIRITATRYRIRLVKQQGKRPKVLRTGK
jgi:hypothetical protein